MLERIKAHIQRYNLLTKGDKVVVACSGGPDSLALLYILSELRPDYQLELAVAHVNHMFRIESKEEAIFVGRVAGQLGVAYYQAEINVPEYIEKTGLSAEEAARIVRYRFLYQVAEEWQANKIATGHHRDDQAETVLLHLLRGSGGKGLGAMKRVNGTLIRPLLSVSRREIEEYCRLANLHPCEDKSNQNLNFLRNRIRLELIPHLEDQYNSALRSSLCRTAEIIGDEHDFICRSAQEAWKIVGKEQPDRLYIDGGELAKYHISVQRQIFRLAIEKKQGHLKGISFLHVENLIEMALRGSVGSILPLPGGLMAQKDYSSVELVFGGQSEAKTNIPLPELMLNIPGSTLLPQLDAVIIARFSEVPVGTLSPEQAVFDWNELEEPLVVRTRQKGDRFNPLGIKGSKKLKEFFIDSKIPRCQRDNIPLICDQRGIVWAAGYRQSERGKATAETSRFLQLTLMKQEDYSD
jgi:tRNA(Ile)-lysidine synthase